MRAKRTKTNAFDWALIRWARLREENERVAEPPLEPKKNERGRLVDPIGFLSERAEKILDGAGISSARFRERVLGVWYCSLIGVAALGAFVFPFARAERLLGGGVNLAGPFVFFLLGQIFFLATSLLFVGIALFQSFLRLFRRKEAPRTFAERAVERLCGLIGWVALVGLRQGIRVFYALFGERRSGGALGKFFLKKKAEKNDAEASATPRDAARDAATTDPNPVEKRIALLFWDSLFAKPRFLFFWGGVLSHLFWASCSICVLSILVVRMQGNRYDYRWHTSLEDERVVKKCVDFLGYPIAKFGGAVPTQEDVRRLFVEERTLAGAVDASLNPTKKGAAPVVVVLESDKTSGALRVAPTTNSRKMEAKTRALWSRFLLSVVFVWCVAPRCFLVGAYYFLLRRSLRDFKPNLNDPYFRDLIDRAEAYSTTTRAAIVFDDEIDETPVAQIETPPDVSPRGQISRKVEPIPKNFQEKRDVAQENADNNDAAPKIDVEIAQNGQIEANRVNAEIAPPCETEKSAPTGEVAQTAPTSTPRIALALGYDATFSAERWNGFFDARRPPVVFGDVAADVETKKRFRTWARANGSAVEICTLATDVSLSPARHVEKFLRDDLGAALANARIFVVLSDGEKLRRKFGATSAGAVAVAERVGDWRRVLAELSRSRVLPFEPIFFYDGRLDLPEPRERLRNLLTNAAREKNADRVVAAPRNWDKWNAAAARIDAASRQIFDADAETASESEREERDRRRAASLCAEIFAIYREQADAVASSAAEVGPGADSTGAALLARLTKIGETTGALGTSLTSTLVERGIDVAMLERTLAKAAGLSAKMRALCGKLSPKCALAVGALGVSAPIVAAFAPLFGGALTATALASTFGAVGSLVPTAFASGATGAALGAVAPLSFAACKRKLVEKWRGVRTSRGAEIETNALDAAADSASPNAAAPVFSDATVESVAATVCAAATWAVALELQGRPEDEIVAALPVATRPLETSPLDAPETVRQALDEIRDEIRKLRELEKTEG